MKDFVNRILAELTTNESVNGDPLVQILVESTNKSIALGEKPETTYNALKTNLSKINEHSKNATISSLLEEFSKNDDTDDSKVAKIATSGKLLEKLTAIKGAAKSNPIIASQAQGFENSISSGISEVHLYFPFIQTFEKYSYDATIKAQVEALKNHINENKSKLLVLGAILEMERTGSPVYTGAKNDLKSMLVNESYSADILKLKYKNTLPLINSLIADLRVVESEENKSFTLGDGDGNTTIKNMIAPAQKTEDGLIIFTDNRFISIRESKELKGNEAAVHINDNFTIATVNPEYVKENYLAYYNLCEAYSVLGFKNTDDGSGVESSSIRNFKVGFKVNEKKSLDLYLNESKVEDPKNVNLTDLLVLENESIKYKISSIFENFSNIFHFEFIKDISNDLTLSEATVVNLDESFYLCEKPNTADRNWKKVTAMEMFEFFKTNFKYDISSLFKVKLDEEIETVKSIEAGKSEILANVAKLEETIKKLDDTINAGVSSEDAGKLEEIKESVQKTIKNLKDDFIKLDLSKKTK